MKSREQRILNEILKEYKRAVSKHSPFNSCHEGWAVIKEEFDELWDEVKKRREVRSQDVMIKEAVQTGAMTLRFLMELTAFQMSKEVE